MRITTLSILTAIALALGVTPAEAAKGNKGNKREANRTAFMLGRMDRDGNGKLEGKESERLKNIYGALRKLDTDANGELSESEIAAAEVKKPQGRKGKKSDGANAQKPRKKKKDKGQNA
jgi:hypothetical protein